jgi:hypothetical protein
MCSVTMAVFAFGAFAAQTPAGKGKPVALVGVAAEGVAFQHDLLAGARIRAVRHFGKENPLLPADYSRYAFMFFNDAANGPATDVSGDAADGGWGGGGMGASLGGACSAARVNPVRAARAGARRSSRRTRTGRC